MRTTEERIAEMYRRREQIVREQKNRRFTGICALSAAACFAILTGIAMMMSRFSGTVLAGGPADSMEASIFSGSETLGYIVISILAFLLGITVTVFCFRLKKWMDEKDRKGS